MKEKQKVTNPEINFGKVPKFDHSLEAFGGIPFTQTTSTHGVEED